MSDGGRRPRAPRLVRSVRRRPAAFVVLVVLSVLAVAVSVLTPMLLRAVQQASLSDSIARASPLDRSVIARSLATAGTSLDTAVTATEQVGYALADARLWQNPVEAVGSLNFYPWEASANRARDESGLVAVVPDSGCASFRVLQGRCPVAASQVLVPASVWRLLHVRIGSTVELNPTSPSSKIVLTIAGVYDDAHGYGRVLAAPDALAGTPLSLSSPALVIGRRHIDDLGIDLVSYLSDSVRQPVGIDSLAELDTGVAMAKSAALSGEGGAASATVGSGLPDLLGRLQTQNAAAATITGAIALESLALTWFALAAVIQRISRVRAVEWGIGRTRGIRRGVWLGTVFAEPLLAVLVGSALGLLVGVLLAAAIVRAALGPGLAPEPFRPPVVAAAALAVAGSLVALVAASVQSARLPLPSLLRETTEPRRLSRLALVAQVGVVLVTAIVGWAVLTQPRVSGPQIALLAPSLIALLFGIAALRLTVVLVRGATARPPRSLAGLVVGRQLARAPSVLGGAVMIGVALALAAYVLSLLTVARTMQEERAEVDVGAPTVLHVSLPVGSSLENAVRAADPSGREAMAARVASGVGITGTSRILAVDVPRLAAITTWRRAWRGPSPATIVRHLDPATGSGLVFRGTRLSLAFAHVRDASADEADPGVRLSVTFDTGAGWRTIDLGALGDGVLTSGPGEVPCSTGCRLIDLSAVDPNSTTTGPFEKRATLTAISTDQQPASAFTPWLTGTRFWRQRIVDETDPTLPGSATAAATSGGLDLDLAASNGGVAATLEPDVGPRTLPVLLASRTPLQSFAGISDAVFGVDLNQGPLVLTVAGRAPVLPRLGGSGVLVDIDQLQRVSDTAVASATDEVWLAPGRQTAVRSALRREGVRVLSQQTLAETAADDQDEAPVRALGLVSATAGTALLLALLAVVGARAIGGAARRQDLRTLRAAGVGAGRLGLLSAVEFAVPTAAGAVLGVLAGAAGYAFTVTHLPLLAGDGTTPPLDYSPPWAALLLLAAGSAVVVILVAAAAGTIEARRVRA